MASPTTAWLTLSNFSSRITPEQQFVFLAARPFISDEALESIGTAGKDSSFDWNAAIELARKAAVYPMVHENLAASGNSFCPADAREKLDQMYRAAHRNGLILTYELKKLLSELEAIGIPALTFKGPTMAITGYGSLRRRVFGDVDVVVPAAQAKATQVHLLKQNYEEVDPFPEQIRSSWSSYIPLIHRPHGNANGFVRGAGTAEYFHVDLHWGMTPRFMGIHMPMEPLWRRSRAVELPSGSVTTFSKEDTFLLICLHGLKHAWNELKLFTDLSAFLSANEDLDWIQIKESATEAELVRCVSSALRLAELMTETNIPAAARQAFPLAERDEHVAQSVKSWRLESSAAITRLFRGYQFHLRARDRWYQGLGACFAHSTTISGTLLARR